MKKLYVLTFCVLFCLTGAAQSFSPLDTMPIHIPNSIAITPNGDGINDYFSIPQNDLIKNLEFYVFTRSGAIVYHTTKKDFEWSGTLDGKIIKGAIYIYYLYIEYKEDVPVDDKRQKIFRGTITTL